MVSARSIWSQAAAKFSPIGPTAEPRATQYCIAGGLRLVGVGARAGVDARLGFEPWLIAPVSTKQTRPCGVPKVRWGCEMRRYAMVSA